MLQKWRRASRNFLLGAELSILWQVASLAAAYPNPYTQENEEETMKKALLASTAFVAMSGAAYAQGVTLSGFAEAGISDDGSGDAQFHQDVDVTFKMEAMTDAGLTFGTAVDLDEDAGGVGSDDNGVAAYIKGPFGNVTLGDTDGAFDWALTEVGGAGAIADNHTGHAGWSAGGNKGLARLPQLEGFEVRNPLIF
ncbi:MAG: porin, partial [Boseongicola sp. SB0673_bin_14]|nr:porin [Boseongicola sp. SB0667_bin_21]MYI67956.1 porin [Boseongicola sp. SB0673_bin_14]